MFKEKLIKYLMPSPQLVFDSGGIMNDGVMSKSKKNPMDQSRRKKKTYSPNYFYGFSQW